MNYLQQVRRAVDFIEANLDHELDLTAVAAAAGISRWHFQRIWKALVKETLKGYIRKRRLSGAMDKLLTTDERILDIALSAGYDSQEAFTRAFKQAFHHTPNEFRKRGNKSLFLKKAEIDEAYLRHMDGNLSLEPAFVEAPARLYVGLRTRFFSSDSERNNIASTLPALWAAFVPRLDEISYRVPCVCYGIIAQTSADSEQLEYTAAAEVTELGELPVGMVCVNIPATKYARFEHRGTTRQLDHSVNYIYSNWLCSSGHRHTYGCDLEIYGARYHPTSDDSVIHYAIPIDRAQSSPPGPLESGVVGGAVCAGNVGSPG